MSGEKVADARRHVEELARKSLQDPPVMAITDLVTALHLILDVLAAGDNA